MTELLPPARSQKIIFILLLVFCSPLLLSFCLIDNAAIMNKVGTSNHGQLLAPVRELENKSLYNPLQPEMAGEVQGKWSLVYLSRGCEQDCVQALYRMRQLQLAMGKYAMRVQRIAVVVADEQVNWPEQLQPFSGQWLLPLAAGEASPWIAPFRIDADDVFTLHRLYLVDPLGNLILYFAEDADPKGIIADLKKLLQGSRIG